MSDTQEKPSKPPKPEVLVSVEERPRNPITTAGIQPGHVMAIFHYVIVTEVAPAGDAVTLTDRDTGLTWERRGVALLDRMLSADQYTETLVATRTQMEKLLESAGDHPFSVCFIKQGDVKKGTANEERILRGRLLPGSVPSLGRSAVLDLDIVDPDDRIRQVDHRTIQWLVMDGVRYTLKK